jgi:3-hydroxyisobutyrate dehydrogenase-like beta-hydroxyacid dehydrogenase
MQSIAFVGVGKIGTEVAKHLLAAGYEVLGYRLSSLAEFAKIGGTPAESPAAIGERADIVFSCLPGGGDSLDEAVNGPRGLVQFARAGQIVAELGSHALPVKERQVERLAAKGAKFLDGEVGGTPGMVAQRKAPIYLAGDADACDDLADRTETSTPLFRLAADLFKRGIERGLAQHDVASIIEVVHEMSAEESERAKRRYRPDAEKVPHHS